MANQTVKSEYGKEVAVETRDGDVISGEWSKKQMSMDDVRVGYMSDPFEGFRSIPLVNMLRHTAISGPTGYGKSTALQNIAVQVRNSYGFVYVDPKGGAFQKLQTQLPDEELDSILHFDFNSEDAPEEKYGLDLLNVDSEADVKNAIEVITQLVCLSGDGNMGSRSEEILRNVLEVVINYPETVSFTDLYDVLANSDSRDTFREHISTKANENVFKRLDENPDYLDPLLRRVSQLQKDDVLQKFVFQPGTTRTITFRDLLTASQSKKSFLISAGNVSERSFLPEAVLFSFWQALTRRNKIPEEKRVPYMFLLDDLDWFSFETQWFENMLSRGRALQIGLTVVFQQLDQLPKSVKNSILGNCSNLLIFRASNPLIANKFSTIFEEYGRNHFLNLERFEFMGRILNQYSETVTVQGNVFPEYRTT